MVKINTIEYADVFEYLNRLDDESIDLTQNLCYWMYENNFTCSKLSLINNEK